jgi:hypothetical protein
MIRRLARSEQITYFPENKFDEDNTWQGEYEE